MSGIAPPVLTEAVYWVHYQGRWGQMVLHVPCVYCRSSWPGLLQEDSGEFMLSCCRRPLHVAPSPEVEIAR